MSHFYGTLQGARGEATRRGRKTTGLTTTAASWKGAVRVTLTHAEETGRDVAEVRLVPWHGSGVDRLLYRGPVDEPETSLDPEAARHVLASVSRPTR